MRILTLLLMIAIPFAALAALPDWFWRLTAQELTTPDLQANWTDDDGRHTVMCWFRELEGKTVWAGLQLDDDRTLGEALSAGATTLEFSQSAQDACEAGAACHVSPEPAP